VGSLPLKNYNYNKCKANTFTSFEALMAVMFWFKVFWVVTPYSVVVGYHYFRGPWCLHLQGEVAGMEKIA
jgi:hypothetical protein